jgi:hypothetical protein
MPAQRHHCHLRHLFRHHLWMVRLRSPSRLGIAKRRSTLLMNSKSTLNSLQKTSTIATQFSGGWAVEVNFRASFGWRVMFYAFLVSTFIFAYLNLRDFDLNFLSQVLQLPLKGSSRVDGTQYLSDAQDSSRKLFASSCSSRSVFTSTMPGPKRPSSISTPFGPRTALTQHSRHSLSPPPLGVTLPLGPCVALTQHLFRHRLLQSRLTLAIWAARHSHPAPLSSRLS